MITSSAIRALFDFCRTLLSAIADLVFPPRCLVCNIPLDGSNHLMFCPQCKKRVRFLKEPLCVCCGKIFQKASGGEHLCGKCLTGKWFFDKARGLVLYEKPVSEIIHHFKYQGRTVSLKTFKTIFNAEITLSEYSKPDLVVPVPLHPKKLRQRGFNQAVVLARSLYDQKYVNCNVLIRTRHTAPQTGLNGKERRRNLKNAFQVTDKSLVENKHILLVDDVFTTGTTVNECAKTLKKAGAKKILVLTLARVTD